MVERSLVFTLYRNSKDTVGEQADLPWASWVELLSIHDIRPSEANQTAAESTKDGPAVLFGRLDGKRRKKGNVLSVDALSLDLDDIPTIDGARLNWGRVFDGLEWVCYSTHKNGLPETVGPRLRFVFPVDRPVSPEEFETVRRGFDRLTFQLSDSAARDIARLNYLPSTWSSNPKHSFFCHNAGKWASVERLQELGNVDPEPADVQVVRRLLKKSNDKASRAVLDGRPFAWPGTRHDTLLTLTMQIASASKNDKAPSVESVVHLFSKSLEAMRGLFPSSAPTVDELIHAYQGAVEKCGKEISSRVESMSLTQLRGSEPYSDDDLKSISMRAGLTSLNRAWVLQKDASYYMLTEDGSYRGPFTQNEARPAMAEILSRAPVRLWEITRSGAKKRTVGDIVEDHGRVVGEVIADLMSQFSHYDERTNTIREAVRPIRSDLSPIFHAQVDQFLNIFGGPQAEKLKDWIACVPDCSKLLCALYLAGSPGTGKTSLAHGLARLWHEGPPTEFFRLLGDFNADLCNCPLVLADEHVPLYWKGGSVTKLIRSVIACDSRPLARKYLPTTTLNGAIRLILASNDDFLLKSTEAMGASDLEAVSERFLYVEAPEDARKFLETIPSEKKEQWLAKDIAEHALWLFENRQVQRAKRFWVSGSISTFHRLLVQSSDINAQVNQWLVYYLTNPAPIDAKGDGFVRIDRATGRFLVNDQAVIDGWATYFPNSRLEPTVAKIGAALRAISLKERERLRFKGQRIRYRVIDLESLFAWSEASNIGDRETMERTLGRIMDDESGEVTDDLASIRGSGKTPKEKLEQIRKENRTDPPEDFDDPNEVDELGNRVPF